MSSALSGIGVFPDDTGGLRNEFREQQMPSPFFEADMPWPETPEYAPPEPWIPESGEYRFVPEEIVRKLEAPATGQRQEYQRYMPHPVYMPASPVRPPYYGY
jgi:hypothetical protein